jgi:Ca2+-transporting ATPase
MARITKEQLTGIGAAEDAGKAAAALGGVKAIAEALGSDLKSGLTSGDRVAANRAQFGQNLLPEKALKSFLEHIWEALEDETVRILMFSAFCSMTFAFFITNDDGKEEDFIQGIAILSAVVVVAAVQSFQNWSKDREFRSLSALRANRDVRVVRDGAEAFVSIFDVVVGDVMVLSSGDVMPCDGLLIEGVECEVDQSSMTGESEPVPKAPGGDAFLIGSTALREGEGRMIATAVGKDSRMGVTVMALTEAEPGETPLQERLNELAGQIGRIGMAAGALTFLVLSALWYLREDPNKRATEILQYFIIGVAIVVVAVPEGLPLAVTISLAFSMRRMMADNNLVRTLAACETMGSATVICSDKTGTLTENRMSVEEAWAMGKYVQVAELRKSIEPGGSLRLSRAIAMNSTGQLEVDNGRVQFVGSPSECALLLMLQTALQVDYRSVRSEYLARRPFNKAKKYMSTIVAGDMPGGESILYVTGAPEEVLRMCSVQQGAGGDEVVISEERRFNLNVQVQAMAAKGLRALAVAYRRLPNSKVPSGGKGGAGAVASFKADLQAELMSGSLETGAMLLGLFGLQDPLRQGVKEAVDQCVAAGIRVMMVTGDHPETAKHIATAAGIYSHGGLIMEGAAFRKLSDIARTEAAHNLCVLARCSPSDKLLLVNTLKAADEVVAVTGDGTNDAPALRAADVGLAMGISGTEVAKEASDIIILDDRFSSIVASVRWGRSIKENIRKFLSFQLTINIVALTLTFVAACTSGGRNELPLKPVQLLWVNLIMDSFAALALATEPPSEKLMNFAPQGKAESLITRTMFKNMIGHALFQTMLLLWMTQVPSSAHFFGLQPEALGTTPHDTIVFTSFVSLQVFNLFNCRTVHDEWNVLEDFGSSYVGQAILVLIIIMQWIIVQFGGEIMQTVPLSVEQWTSCILIGATSVPVGFLLKLIPACEYELRKIAPGTPRARAASQPEVQQLQRNISGGARRRSGKD